MLSPKYGCDCVDITGAARLQLSGQTADFDHRQHAQTGTRSTCLYCGRRPTACTDEVDLLSSTQPNLFEKTSRRERIRLCHPRTSYTHHEPMVAQRTAPQRTGLALGDNRRQVFAAPSEVGCRMLWVAANPTTQPGSWYSVPIPP